MFLELQHPIAKTQLIIDAGLWGFHSSYMLNQHRLFDGSILEDSVQRLAVKSAVNELEWFCKQLNDWLEENDNVG